jgi:hypothetical protein
MPVAGHMELFALSGTGEAAVIASATGGLALAGLIAFGLWWFRPFRSDADVGEQEEEQRIHGDR